MSASPEMHELFGAIEDVIVCHGSGASPDGERYEAEISSLASAFVVVRRALDLSDTAIREAISEYFAASDDLLDLRGVSFLDQRYRLARAEDAMVRLRAFIGGAA